MISEIQKYLNYCESKLKNLLSGADDIIKKKLVK